ncbi:MAG: GyrI-like domain-containing protein, partial [Clostridiales bacterium]|nr:GyrI-like domain-containing protein [Clostridiales bacterium]
MMMKTQTIPAYKVAYIRHVGPYGIGNVQTMEDLKNWAKSNDLLHDKSIILGIAHDHPETTKPENCRYDSCIVVSDDFCIHNGNVRVGHIAGGSYAVFKISHTAEAVQKAWLEIFPELLKHGYQFDETRPVLERYLAE